MSTERDELIDILWQTATADRVRDGKDLRNVPVVRSKCEEVADAILAAGYTKPRQVSTVEELDALPFNSIVSFDEGYVPGCIEYIRPEALLPATVLYSPAQS